MASSFLSYEQLYQPRFKHNIYFTQTLPHLPWIDVGYHAAGFLTGLSDKTHISLHLEQWINGLLSGEKRLLPLMNTGLLLEPSLGVDFFTLLGKCTGNQVVVMHWPGEIRLPWVYFLTQSKGLAFDLSHLHPKHLPEYNFS